MNFKPRRQATRWGESPLLNYRAIHLRKTHLAALTNRTVASFLLSMVQKRDSGGPTRSIKSLEFEENIDFSIAQAIVLLDKFDQVEKEAFQK
jgi:hypothetical protein